MLNRPDHIVYLELQQLAQKHGVETLFYIEKIVPTLGETLTCSLARLGKLTHDGKNYALDGTIIGENMQDCVKFAHERYLSLEFPNLKFEDTLLKMLKVPSMEAVMALQRLAVLNLHNFKGPVTITLKPVPWDQKSSWARTKDFKILVEVLEKCKNDHKTFVDAVWDQKLDWQTKPDTEWWSHTRLKFVADGKELNQAQSIEFFNMKLPYGGIIGQVEKVTIKGQPVRVADYTFELWNGPIPGDAAYFDMTTKKKLADGLQSVNFDKPAYNLVGPGLDKPVLVFMPEMDAKSIQVLKIQILLHGQSELIHIVGSDWSPAAPDIMVGYFAAGKAGKNTGKMFSAHKDMWCGITLAAILQKNGTFLQLPLSHAQKQALNEVAFRMKIPSDNYAKVVTDPEEVLAYIKETFRHDPTVLEKFREHFVQLCRILGCPHKVDAMMNHAMSLMGDMSNSGNHMEGIFGYTSGDETYAVAIMHCGSRGFGSQGFDVIAQSTFAAGIVDGNSPITAEFYGHQMEICRILALANRRMMMSKVLKAIDCELVPLTPEGLEKSAEHPLFRELSEKAGFTREQTLRAVKNAGEGRGHNVVQLWKMTVDGEPIYISTVKKGAVAIEPGCVNVVLKHERVEIVANTAVGFGDIHEIPLSTRLPDDAKVMTLEEFVATFVKSGMGNSEHGGGSVHSKGEEVRTGSYDEAYDCVKSANVGSFGPSSIGICYKRYKPFKGVDNPIMKVCYATPKSGWQFAQTYDVPWTTKKFVQWLWNRFFSGCGELPDDFFQRKDRFQVDLAAKDRVAELWKSDFYRINFRECHGILNMIMVGEVSLFDCFEMQLKSECEEARRMLCN